MTRKLVITQNMTLDGSIQMLDDWFDDQQGADDPDFMEENRRQDAAADTLLVGRQTFLDFRGYWRDLDWQRLPTLIEAGLVDEYRLWIYPVVQGRGSRLFPDGFATKDLRLLEARSFATGQAIVKYAAR